MTKPTREDADILLRLAELSASYNLPAAATLIWNDDFPADFARFRDKFPKGKRSEEEGLLQRYLDYFETAGTCTGTACSAGTSCSTGWPSRQPGTGSRGTPWASDRRRGTRGCLRTSNTRRNRAGLGNQSARSRITARASCSGTGAT